MKNILLLAAAAVLPLSASAHLETGYYDGTDRAGNACTIHVSEVSFAEGLRHPINERVTVEWDGMHFELRHPPRVDFEASEIGFVRSELSDARFLGAETVALRMVMIHSEDFHGPGAFQVVRSGADGTRNLMCDQIRHRD